MRGKECSIASCPCPPGITPACAGKRRCGILRTKPRRDHPRVCGEKYCRVIVVPNHIGSPPRMRGKGTYSAAHPICARITPAYAGKSCEISCIYFAVRDHPRVCGEKVNPSACGARRLGSPPRMRGKASATSCARSSSGITPAYAGKRLKKSKKINNPSPLAHRISFSFSYTANVRRQSVSARCAPETSRPKYVASVVSL